MSQSNNEIFEYEKLSAYNEALRNGFFLLIVFSV
jgi:hypothetical protein